MNHFNRFQIQKPSVLWRPLRSAWDPLRIVSLPFPRYSDPRQMLDFYNTHRLIEHYTPTVPLSEQVVFVWNLPLKFNHKTLESFFRNTRHECHVFVLYHVIGRNWFWSVYWARLLTFAHDKCAGQEYQSLRNFVLRNSLKDRKFRHYWNEMFLIIIWTWL